MDNKYLIDGITSSLKFKLLPFLLGIEFSHCFINLPLLYSLFSCSPLYYNDDSDIPDSLLSFKCTLGIGDSVFLHEYWFSNSFFVYYLLYWTS